MIEEKYNVEHPFIKYCRELDCPAQMVDSLENVSAHQLACFCRVPRVDWQNDDMIIYTDGNVSLNEQAVPRITNATYVIVGWWVYNDMKNRYEMAFFGGAYTAAARMSDDGLEPFGTQKLFW